jgi:ATP-binding protein involved in chromosome partitioning
MRRGEVMENAMEPDWRRDGKGAETIAALPLFLIGAPIREITMTVAAAGLQGVRHIVAVASGKGGVGKSTTAVNLALALVAEGRNIGLLDADIYGPSIAMLLGLPDGTQPKVLNGNTFVPVAAHNLKTMSMAYLASASTPMVWRGPMAGGALIQMLTQTTWGALDVLVVDMPPGTGDIQLTLAQKAQVSGAVIVTTPQDIALLDARKGIEMFHKVRIPVLGVVENMSLHVCTQCGHAEPIFDTGGGARVAAEYGTVLLGSLPLDRRIREGDAGRPVVVADPEGELAGRYRAIARGVLTALAGLDTAVPEIVIE